MWSVSLVPGIGALAVTVDDLFIFRTDRRCLHDLIAGTKVVAVGATVADRRASDNDG
jgi:hypothetical protein